MVASAEPLLLDLDLLAQDEWSPVLQRADQSLGVFENRVAAITEVLAQFNARIDGTTGPLSATEAAAGQAAAKLGELQSASAEAATGAEEVEAAYAAMVAALGEVQSASAGAAASQEAVAAASIESAGASEKAAVASEGLANAQRSGATAAQAHSASLSQASNSAMMLGGAMEFAASKALGVADGYEAALSKVEGFAGVAHDQMGSINNDLLTMASQAGEAPQKLAQGLYYTVSAGFQAADAMTILRQSTDLAKAAQIDSKTVTDVTTSALRAYGLSASDTAHVQDVLVATVVAGKMEFGDLAGSLGRVLPVAAQAGVSLEQIGASIATMTQKGLSADEAVTAVRGLLLNLEAPSKQTKDELSALGLSADEVRASIRDKGLLQTMTDLIARTDGNVDSLHQLIPNVRALTGVLADAGKSGDDYKTVLASVQDSSGAASRAIEAHAETSEQSLNRLKATMDVAFIQTFGSAAKELQPFIDDITQLVSWFEKLSASQPGVAALGRDLALLVTVGGGGLALAGGLGFLVSQLEHLTQFLNLSAPAARTVAAANTEVATSAGAAAAAESSLAAAQSSAGTTAAAAAPEEEALAAADAEVAVAGRAAGTGSALGGAAAGMGGLGAVGGAGAGEASAGLGAIVGGLGPLAAALALGFGLDALSQQFAAKPGEASAYGRTQLDQVMKGLQGQSPLQQYTALGSQAGMAQDQLDAARQQADNSTARNIQEWFQSVSKHPSSNPFLPIAMPMAKIGETVSGYFTGGDNQQAMNAQQLLDQMQQQQYATISAQLLRPDVSLQTKQQLGADDAFLRGGRVTLTPPPTTDPAAVAASNDRGDAALEQLFLRNYAQAGGSLDRSTPEDKGAQQRQQALTQETSAQRESNDTLALHNVQLATAIQRRDDLTRAIKDHTLSGKALTDAQRELASTEQQIKNLNEQVIPQERDRKQGLDTLTTAVQAWGNELLAGNISIDRYNQLIKDSGALTGPYAAQVGAVVNATADQYDANQKNNDALDAARQKHQDNITTLAAHRDATDTDAQATRNLTDDQAAAAGAAIKAGDNWSAAAIIGGTASDTLVGAWLKVSKGAQDSASATGTATSEVNTDLQTAGQVTPDLSGYQASLVAQALAAGAAARAAIEGQMRNIIGDVSVTIKTDWSGVPTIPGTVAGAAVGAAGVNVGGGVGGPSGGSDGGGGGGAGTAMGLLAFDENSPLLLDSLFAFDASGPRPPTTPGSSGPKAPTGTIKDYGATAAKGAAKSGGASPATRSAAQGIAAAHSAMQADAQSIQKEVDDALAEFDALVHPDGKNALLARLTADLTNSDTVAGLADAERILFREALVQGGQAGANASADQLVNAWLQQASKGITDPAKLDQLKAQAQRLLQALGDAMPEIAETVSANKGIDLAASLFSDLGSPDSVKTLTRQVASLIESGRPDADEAVRHLLFGDGTPSAKQASDAAKVATAVRNLLIQNVDLNDPASITRLQQQLADLQAALQAQATRQGLTIPVSLDAPDQNASAGIPGLIPVPTSSGGSSPFSARSAAGALGGITPGRGGWRPPDEPAVAPTSVPETPEQAAARVNQQGRPKTDAVLEDEMATEVAQLLLQGQQFQAIQRLMTLGSQEAVQRVMEKVNAKILLMGATTAQKLQAIDMGGVAKATAVSATPLVSTDTSAADQVADQQAQAALNPGSASNRVEQEAQTLAQLIEKGDPGSAQQYLSRIPKADFEQVVARARKILEADAKKNGTTAADLAKEKDRLNSAETAAAPTAATNLSPEEKAKQQAADEAKKKDPAYWSSKEAVAESDAITARRNADPGGDFGKNSANAGTVFLYAADAVMEQIRQGERAYKQMIDQLAAAAAAQLAAQRDQNTKPIVVRMLATMNGRVVSEETSYHTGESQQYADLGMPTGRRG